MPSLIEVVMRCSEYDLATGYDGSDTSWSQNSTVMMASAAIIHLIAHHLFATMLPV